MSSNKRISPTVVEYSRSDRSLWDSQMSVDTRFISEEIEVRQSIQQLLDSNIEMLETILNKQSLTIQELDLKIGVKIEDKNEG